MSLLNQVIPDKLVVLMSLADLDALRRQTDEARELALKLRNDLDRATEQIQSLRDALQARACVT